MGSGGGRWPWLLLLLPLLLLWRPYLPTKRQVRLDLATETQDHREHESEYIN